MYYAVTSDGEFIEVPFHVARWGKFFRKSEHRLSKLQVRLAKKQKHSKPRQILKLKIAKLHLSCGEVAQQIARQGLDWQFKLAAHLFSDGRVLFVRRLANREPGSAMPG